MPSRERKIEVKRDTEETSIRLKINLDGAGRALVDTGIKFLDHILGAFTKHGLFDLEVLARQRKAVDEHHVVEDVGICLGKAVDLAIGNKRGIKRFGYAIIPMDDALALVALDLCGRSYFLSNFRFKRKDVGDLPTDLVKHFLQSMASNGRFVMHAYIIRGEDDHHKAEALFKALGVALHNATTIDERLRDRVSSQKGALD